MGIFGKDPFDEVEDVFSESIWNVPSGTPEMVGGELSGVRQGSQGGTQHGMQPPISQQPISQTAQPQGWQGQQVPVMIPQVVPQIPYPPVISPYYPYQEGVTAPGAPPTARQEVLRKKKEEAEVAPKKKEEKKRASYLLNFRLANELYGVDVSSIREVVRAGKITPVPNTHYHILGIMNLRGRIIPVISLRRFFGMEDIGIDRKIKILVVEDEDGNQTGVLVDDVNEVFLYYADELEPITTVKFSGSRYAKGILKKDDNPIVVIDIREVISESTFGLSL